MYLDVLTAELQPTGSMAGAAPDTALTSELILAQDGRVESGIWEVSPGIFHAVHGSYIEVMHFVAGAATITADDGEVYDIAPGVVLKVPAGWTGTWEVRQTVRKTYLLLFAVDRPA